MATTWNPSDKDASIALSNGNETAAGTVTSSWRSVRATTSHTDGQYYFRVQANSFAINGDVIVGLANASASLTNFIGSDIHGIGSQCPNANSVYVNGTPLGNAPGLGTSGDYFVIAVALASNLYWSTVENSGVLNTDWNNLSGSPAAGTGGFSMATVANGVAVYPAFSAFDANAQVTLDTTTTISDSTLTGFTIWDQTETAGLSKLIPDLTMIASAGFALTGQLSSTIVNLTLSSIAWSPIAGQLSSTIPDLILTSSVALSVPPTVPPPPFNPFIIGYTPSGQPVFSMNSPGITKTIPSYLYTWYQDDDNLQAFVAEYNGLTQEYVNWFNQINLPIYTGQLIADYLLDWVSMGLYGYNRPVGMSDDILKRTLTWHFYKGDGKYFGVRWLKRRIMRYLAGINGTDQGTSSTYNVSVSFGVGYNVTIEAQKVVISGAVYDGWEYTTQTFPNGYVHTRTDYKAPFLYGNTCYNGNPPRIILNPTRVPVANQWNIFVSGDASLWNAGGVLAITSGTISTDLEEGIASEWLETPFQLIFTVGGDDYPISAVGLPAGSIWSDGGVVAVVPGITPDVTASPLYFAEITAAELLALGGGNLPLANPGAGSDQLWNNGGVVCVA